MRYLMLSLLAVGLTWGAAPARTRVAPKKNPAPRYMPKPYNLAPYAGKTRRSYRIEEPRRSKDRAAPLAEWSSKQRAAPPAARSSAPFKDPENRRKTPAGRVPRAARRR